MKIIPKRVFQKFFNNPLDDEYTGYKDAFKVYPIKEQLHFFAQIAHESNFLKFKKESYYYSVDRILQVFPKYFKGMSRDKIKKKYERKPALLDRVYANRMSNGDEASGDGSRFRGRGYIQLTGRRNYRKYGIENRPWAIVESPYNNWYVCLKFWHENKIDSICDNKPYDLSEKEIRKITKKINGGYNGYKDRVKKSEIIERLYKVRALIR